MRNFKNTFLIDYLRATASCFKRKAYELTTKKILQGIFQATLENSVGTCKWWFLKRMLKQARNILYEYNNNFFFRSVPGNIARGLSTDQTCEVSLITGGNISGTDRKNSYHCFYWTNMLKTYQREIKTYDSDETRIGKTWR